jgi:hypothetical protein
MLLAIMTVTETEERMNIQLMKATKARLNDSDSRSLSFALRRTTSESYNSTRLA